MMARCKEELRAQGVTALPTQCRVHDGECAPVEAPEIVQVPLIDPRVTELQARFSKALANPPKGIDTDVVKPYLDGDEELWAINPEQVGVLMWSPYEDRWTKAIYTYSNHAFEDCTLLRWTVGVIPAPEDMISGRAYFQNNAEGEPVGKALTLDSRDHPVEECDRRYEQMKAELLETRAAHDAAVEQHSLRVTQLQQTIVELTDKNMQLVNAAQELRTAYDQAIKNYEYVIGERNGLQGQKDQLTAQVVDALGRRNVAEADVEALKAAFAGIVKIGKAFK